MVSIAMRQIILIGVICFGTIGMFNAMSSIGNAGKHSPTSQNLAVTSSSIAYIVGFLLAGGAHNVVGPRPCVAFGGLTFVLYAGSMLLAKDNDHSPYPPLAGILLGLGAGCIWVTQGAMMMSYPTEDNKGKYIACFWAIFNLGAVLGSILPLVMNNAPGMDKDDVSPSTYVVYMIIMGLATLLAFFLARPSSIVRDNGEPIVIAKFAGLKAEGVAVLSVFCDWRMLLLIPAFFFSNFSYTYQFNDFNGVHFNIRTRSLNSILFWVAQIIGALVIGSLLDRIPLRRQRRALLGLMFIACLFMATWVGALMMQIQHKWERKTVPNDSDLIDYEHGDSYSGPLAIYAMFGFCDAAFAVYCYWLMGALSNKHDELSRYAGFFKSIQSLGSAVAAPLDLAQTPLLAYLITNWILCALSIAAMFLVCRTVTDTTLEEEEEEDEYYDDEYYDGTTADSYSIRSNVLDGDDEEEASQGEPELEQGQRAEQQRRSDSNRSRTLGRDSSTLCATSERSKSGCWRSSNGNLDSEDGLSEQHLTNHDSYMSSATAVSSQSQSQSKRRSSSILSASSAAGRAATTCPSPTFQPAHQQVRRSTNGRLARAQPSPQLQAQAQVPMQEIQRDASLAYYYYDYDQASTPTLSTSQLVQRQQEEQLRAMMSSSPSIVGPTLPSIVFSTDLPVSSSPGSSSNNPYIYSSWSTSPPTESDPVAPVTVDGSSASVPSNEYLQPYPLFATTTPQAQSSTTSVQQTSIGGASQASSTRYEEDQDMDDSIDTCSLSSMSSGRESMPDMADMDADPGRPATRTRSGSRPRP